MNVVVAMLVILAMLGLAVLGDVVEHFQAFSFILARSGLGFSFAWQLQVSFFIDWLGGGGGLISNYKNGLFCSSILLFCGSFFVSQSGSDLFCFFACLLAGPLDGRGLKKSLLPPGTEWNGTSNKIGRYQVMNSTMTKKCVWECVSIVSFLLLPGWYFFLFHTFFFFFFAFTSTCEVRYHGLSKRWATGVLREEKCQTECIIVLLGFLLSFLYHSFSFAGYIVALSY